MERQKLTTSPIKVLIINGPNLNLLGRREPDIYGPRPFEPFLEAMSKRFPEASLRYLCSNSEGEIIDAIHSARFSTVELQADAVILNAGAYTHYSYAIADAIRAIEPVPVIEVHISNPAAREPFRRTSVIAPVCKGTISGFGLESYTLALSAVINANTPKSND